MDGDVICECPLPIAFSSCATAVWPSKLLSHSPGKKRRSPRPHSSPVRERKERKNQGISSPAAIIPSPSQVYQKSPLPVDFFTPPPSPGLSYEASSKVPTNIAKSGLPSNKTYFSSLPPPVPLVLVPIPSSVAVIYANNKNTRKQPQEHNLRLVRIILQEVINALPLSNAATPRPCVKTRDEHLVSSYNHSRLSSESSLVGNESYKCHVATQAHTNKNVQRKRTTSPCVSAESSADEWLGGVRALRDSHVRLVLRQLRHIDRLNRALDRVRYTTVGKAPDVTTKDKRRLLTTYKPSLTDCIKYVGRVVAVAGKRFIALRDNEFVGPDKQLEESLTRCMAVDETELVHLLNHLVPRPMPTHILAGQTRRLANITRNNPKDEVLYLIKFIIYSIQNRLDDFDPIVIKYKDDDKLRIGHIFCKLDLWLIRMILLYNTIKAKTKARLYEHFINYQHILAVNIDVTYTIEFLINLQNAIEKTEMKNNDTQNEENHEGPLSILQSNIVQKEFEKYKDRNLTAAEIKDLEKKLEAHLYSKGGLY